MTFLPEHLDPTFFLFTTDPELAREAQQAGVDSVIVDWERMGKAERQDGFETEINSDTPEDAAALAETLDIPVTVRVNQLHPGTPAEVEQALACGAEILMLPMARTPEEVQRFVDLVGKRAKTLVQIETQSLAGQCEKISGVGWDYAHIGLNDLMVTGDYDWLWKPLADGTIERICRRLSGRQVGFASATVVGGGAPISFIKLMQEMARLQATVTILRRTFKSEIAGRDMQAELRAYRAVWTALLRREASAAAEDHRRLQKTLRECRPPAQPAPADSATTESAPA